MELSSSDRAAAAYERNHEVMTFIAARKFRVPAADVLPLVHDVFVAYMRHASAIGDDTRWLIAATRNACLNYWRNRKVTEPLVGDSFLDPGRACDDVTASIDIARVLRLVPGQCRAVLWMRYVDEFSPAEIALRCAASESAGYGRQLVHRCLRAARVALADLKAGRA
jgi:DNA-directed RNA polymerase specialized sigma24 family protein